MTAEELRKAREKFIDARQDELDSIGRDLQQKLFDLIVSKFLQLFQQANGKILFNNENIKATNALSRIFDQYNADLRVDFISKFVKNIKNITNLNAQYYETFVEKNLIRFKNVSTRANDLMNYRLGIRDGNKLVPNGFLDSFIKNTSIKDGLREAILKGVTNQISITDLVKDLRVGLMGVGDVPGAVVKQLREDIFDVYQQHDRATSKLFGAALSLRAGIYAGGLIDTSRAFCIKHNDKVWSLDETEDWINDPDLPKTAAERKSGSVTNYDPIVDMGRWRCRHHWNFISDEMARKLRPDVFSGPKTADVNGLITNAKKAAPEVNQLANDVAEANDSSTSGINYKSKASIIRKANDDYNGDVSRVQDAVRTTIIADPENIPGVIKDLKADPSFVRLKEQFAEVDKLGYSGNIINIKTENGINGEIQVNTAELIYAKDQFAKDILGAEMFNKIKAATGLESGLGHTYYEEYRTLDPTIPDQAARMSELEILSREYYAHFY